MEEVRGHYEWKLVEPKFHGVYLSDYVKDFHKFHEGFGYYEYVKSDSEPEPKKNKTVMLLIDSETEVITYEELFSPKYNLL